MQTKRGTAKRCLFVCIKIWREYENDIANYSALAVSAAVCTSFTTVAEEVSSPSMLPV